MLISCNMLVQYVALAVFNSMFLQLFVNFYLELSSYFCLTNEYLVMKDNCINKNNNTVILVLSHFNCHQSDLYKISHHLLYKAMVLVRHYRFENITPPPFRLVLCIKHQQKDTSNYTERISECKDCSANSNAWSHAHFALIPIKVLSSGVSGPHRSQAPSLRGWTSLGSTIYSQFKSS